MNPKIIIFHFLAEAAMGAMCLLAVTKTKFRLPFALIFVASSLFAATQLVLLAMSLSANPSLILLLSHANWLLHLLQIPTLCLFVGGFGSLVFALIRNDRN